MQIQATLIHFQIAHLYFVRLIFDLFLLLQINASLHSVAVTPLKADAPVYPRLHEPAEHQRLGAFLESIAQETHSLFNYIHLSFTTSLLIMIIYCLSFHIAIRSCRSQHRSMVQPMGMRMRRQICDSAAHIVLSLSTSALVSLMGW